MALKVIPRYFTDFFNRNVSVILTSPREKDANDDTIFAVRDYESDFDSSDSSSVLFLSKLGPGYGHMIMRNSATNSTRISAKKNEIKGMVARLHIY